MRAAGGIGVGGIFNPDDAAGAQRGADVLAPLGKQRPQQLDTGRKFTARGNSRQPAQAGAAENAQDHRLGEVIGSVSSENPCGAVPSGGGQERAVADAAQFFLVRRGGRGRIRAQHFRGKAE